MTHNDRVIDVERKGPAGLGCYGQSDAYRAENCQAFACSYLTMTLVSSPHRLGRFQHTFAEA
jgi:hypothetical protein